MNGSLRMLSRVLWLAIGTQRKKDFPDNLVHIRAKKTEQQTNLHTDLSLRCCILATLIINTPTSVVAQSFNPGSFFGSSGFGGFGGGYDDDGDEDGFRNNGNAFGDDNSFFTDIQSAQRRRIIHGALAAVAFVILFPLGAIALKIIPNRAGFFSHVLVQMAAWIIYIAAAALGFQLVKEFRIGGQEEGWLVSDVVPFPSGP